MPDPILDRDFLARQCCGDTALETELLALFVATAGPLVAAMPTMTPAARGDAAHRLRGSCRGIGAEAMARAAQAVENAADTDDAAIVALAVGFENLRRAIGSGQADD